MSRSARGATADSLGKDDQQCLNNQIHHLRVGRRDKDKNASINRVSSDINYRTKKKFVQNEGGGGSVVVDFSNS